MNRQKLNNTIASLHTPLLVLFFLLHNYLLYYGMVSFDAVITVFLKLVLIFFPFILIFWLITKNLSKSLLITSIAGIFFLFYGEFKDLIAPVSPALARYIILLPVTLLLTILLIRLSIRNRNMQPAGIWLTLLFFLWLIIDAFRFLYTDSDTYLQRNLLVNKKEIKAQKTDSTFRPDIYLLVLDSYPGNAFLKKHLDYDNSSFDSVLTSRGFRVLKDPRSNYNRTAFSIASLLNASYLSSINSTNNLLAKNYNHARTSIEHSMVPEFLLKEGYELYNLSVFDIAGQPSMRRETFLTLPEERMLLYNTLAERVRTDILWNLLQGKYEWKFAKKILAKNNADEKYDQRDFNNKVVDSLKKIPASLTKRPRFVYAHLYLPHPPFFYNESGKPNSKEEIIDPASQENRGLFLSYLKYTNATTISVIDKLRETQPGSVIIILSDHGYRDFKGWKSHPEYYNVNYAAWYFPDGNYQSLYDSMTNVNTFPVLLNKYFSADLPLLKDSVVYMPY